MDGTKIEFGATSYPQHCFDDNNCYFIMIIIFFFFFFHLKNCLKRRTQIGKDCVVRSKIESNFASLWLPTLFEFVDILWMNAGLYTTVLCLTDGLIVLRTILKDETTEGWKRRNGKISKQRSCAMALCLNKCCNGSSWNCWN